MLIIDRIDGNTAVIEDGDNRFEVSRSELAPDIKEGDAVMLENGVYRKDTDATEKRRQEIIRLQDSLWE
ncbi:MAG: DUF3006 domain-containing protein [Oscillospiraceae bacterium]|nr:DUF3006 domain-containing protein [Oscillospiraceae bacterium]